MVPRVLCLAAILGLAACGWTQSRYGVGEDEKFSEDSIFKVHAVSLARWRYSYVDRYQTPKDLLIILSKSKSCLFRKEYALMGWDVSWTIDWVSPNHAVISVFDFGPGIDHRKMEHANAVKRSIETIDLEVNVESGDVIEHSSAT